MEKREEEKKIDDAIEVHVESNEFNDETDSQQGPSNLPTGVTHNDEIIFHPFYFIFSFIRQISSL